MHDISLGITVRDYLTGEEIEATTYEDLRQGLSRMLVEELGYPKDRLAARVPVCFPVDGREYSRVADLVATDKDGAPLLIVIFCSGTCHTYRREALAAAWLAPGGPAPLVAVTDCKDAALYATATGKELDTGMRALPRWDILTGLAADHEAPALTEERAERERRILYAYSEMLLGCCSHAACAAEARGGGWSGTQDETPPDSGSDEE